MQERFMSFDRGTVYEANGMQYDGSMQGAELVGAVIEEPVYYFIYNVDNYYHFIYDTLPYLYTYLNLSTRPKLLMQYSAPGKSRFIRFVTETLALLGITESDIIIHRPGNLYRSVTIQSSMTHGGFSNEPPCVECFAVYKRLVEAAEHAVPDSEITPRRIYISRRTHLHGDFSNIGTNYTQRRKMMSEDLLVTELERRGFVEVFCENMTMADKIVMFARAEYVVGAIGGGMCNLLFSGASGTATGTTTKSLVLLSPCFMEINSRFRFSMDHTQIKYCHDYRLITLCDHTPPIARYMRVQVIISGIYGEIEDMVGTEVKVKLASSTAVSVSTDAATEVLFNLTQLRILDGGLNSPWDIDVTAALRLLDETLTS